jgi:hypothetical protein
MIYDQEVNKKYLCLAHSCKLCMKNAKFEVLYQHMNATIMSNGILEKGLQPWPPTSLYHDCTHLSKSIYPNFKQI